jgi:hypothetical protein
MKPRLHVIADNDSEETGEEANFFADLEALQRLSQEHAPEPTPSKPAAARRSRLAETFARFPHDRALALHRTGISSAGWVILIELDRLVLEGRGQNPVRLTNARLKKLGVGRLTKYRQLRLLEKANVVKVQWQEVGAALLIAHLWHPIQR